MSSIRRIISSRINGALSTGPKTDEGKRRISIAAMRHGLLSKCVILEKESQKVFDHVLDSHVEYYQPQNDIEMGLVEDIVCAYWRLRRALAIETSMLNAGMSSREGSTHLQLLESAFAGLADSGKFNTLNRYEARLQRNYQRAIKNLLLVRQNGKVEKNVILQRDPLE